jgi:hypothetical protein
MDAAACEQAMARSAHGDAGLEEESEGEWGDEGAESREERMQLLKGALERLPHCLAALKRIYAVPDPHLVAAPANPLQGAAQPARSLPVGGAGGGGAAVLREGGKDETTPDGAGESAGAAGVDEGGKENQEPAARAHRRGSTGVHAAAGAEGGIAISAQPAAGRFSSGLQPFPR